MLHLIKNPSGNFDIADVANNGNLLNRTTQGFKTKASVYKNVRASMKKYQGAISVYLQDDTLIGKQDFIVWNIYSTSKCLTDKKPHKKYTPKH